MSELPLYLDVDGQQRPRHDWDYHHTIARSSSHGTSEKDFINMKGLLLPLFREWHNQGKNSLHANVANCPMPSKALRLIMREALYEVQEDNVYDRFLYVSETVQGIGKYSLDEGLARSARQVGKNLMAQTPYVLLGQVREVQPCPSV
jgi:hypothetical protein